MGGKDRAGSSDPAQVGVFACSQGRVVEERARLEEKPSSRGKTGLGG